MAVHELVLALGFTIGANGGGYLSDHFDRTMPYLFGYVAIVAAMILQAVVWLALGRSRPPAPGPCQTRSAEGVSAPARCPP